MGRTILHHFLLECILACVAARSIDTLLGLRETNLEALAEDCRLLDDCDRRGYSSIEGPQVCGTNGNTFLNICHLRIVVCQTGNVRLKHEGPCTATEKCPDKRRAALQDRAAGEQGVYVPECLPNGFFEPMQCHTDTGFCWCVLPDGTLIGESANGARIKELNCTASAQTAAQSWRPQSVRNEAPPSRQCLFNSNLGRCNQKGACNVSRRFIFVENMARHILDEFMRLPIRHDPDDAQSAAITWKFESLDRNRDGRLGKREYRDLKKIVRRNVKPKACSKLFPLLCDSDENGFVSLSEWRSCWRPPREPGPISNRVTESTSEKPKRPNGSRCRKGSRCRDGGRRSKKQRRRVSCTEERKKAQRQSLSSGNGTVFVPECDRHGRFRRYQCFGSHARNSWYCWCVSVMTGQILQDTTMNALNNSVPQCNKMVLPTKPWPKCKQPNEEKNFLAALLKFFVTITGSGPNHQKELVVRRVFADLDKNNNNKIDRSEKKALKQKVVSAPELRRCGRRIHKVCDADDDRVITALEWQTCLLGAPQKQHHRDDRRNNATGDVADNPWMSTNPFVELLKPEEEES